MLNNITIQPLAGEFSVTDARLAFVTILCVIRTDKVYSGGELPYAYDSSNGRVTFEIPFSGGPGGGIWTAEVISEETVQIIYKT